MTDAALHGADFVALRRLSTREDVTLAAVGEICDRVPAASLPALLASGKIAPVETVVQAAAEAATEVAARAASADAEEDARE